MHKNKPDLWKSFQEKENLTDEQSAIFRKYYHLLIEANRAINLTTITGLRSVLAYHFSDSLILRKFHDLSQNNLMVDVGAGAGFPAIPLKILYPHLNLILIEVTRKKRQFLEHIVDELHLENVEVCDLDWRTFLRTTQGNADIFVSRAAVDEVELCRLFRENCSYRNAKMVYWASDEWEPHKKAEKYLERVESYTLATKKRKLAFFKVSES